jgi:hypothetical protein
VRDVRDIQDSLRAIVPRVLSSPCDGQTDAGRAEPDLRGIWPLNHFFTSNRHRSRAAEIEVP